MKNTSLLVLLLLLLCMPALASEAPAVDQSILDIIAKDGLHFDGKLSMPAGEDAVQKLVIYVNGSGPNTYDNKRGSTESSINYFDYFVNGFVPRGVAFFSYNTRGVTMGDEPPMFNTIDEAAYQTYKPSNEVDDVACIVKALKAQPRLKDAKVYLLGWSSGTIVSPQVVLKNDVQIDAILLAGYCNDTLAQILDWQQSGGSAMVFYNQYFDYDGNGEVSKEEFEEDRNDAAAQYQMAFEQVDVDANGTITRDDIKMLQMESHDAIFNAFENGDDVWLKENYGLQLTSAWYLDYKNFAPNSEVLPSLTLPIYIFQGRYDRNVSVEGAEAIDAAFKALGKTNLTVQLFDADHDLNFAELFTEGDYPDGWKAIFDTVDAL